VRRDMSWRVWGRSIWRRHDVGRGGMRVMERKREGGKTLRIA